MIRVLKYPIQSNDVEIPMPIGAEVISCDLQHNVPTLWVQLELSGDAVEAPVSQIAHTNRNFRIVMTGERVDLPANRLKFLRTLAPFDGHPLGGGRPLVLHVYEVLPEQH
jgi:hypothetical protein